MGTSVRRAWHAYLVLMCAREKTRTAWHRHLQAAGDGHANASVTKGISWRAPHTARLLENASRPTHPTPRPPKVAFCSIGRLPPLAKLVQRGAADFCRVCFAIFTISGGFSPAQKTETKTKNLTTIGTTLSGNIKFVCILIVNAMASYFRGQE